MTDSSQSVPLSLHHPHRVLGILAVLVLFLLAGVLAFKISEKQGFNQLREAASQDRESRTTSSSSMMCSMVSPACRYALCVNG